MFNTVFMLYTFSLYYKEFSSFFFVPFKCDIVIVFMCAVILFKKKKEKKKNEKVKRK